MRTVHLVIKGKVQGVYYRASARDVAREVGVTGWIKNMTDGNVEALVSGPEERVEKFIEWCRKGPKSAEVSEVIVNDSKEKPLTDFRITK
jgi:acylphosphatase